MTVHPVAVTPSRVHVARPFPAAPPGPLAALVAILTMLLLELMRASGPLIDFAFAEAGLVGAVGSALVAYVAAGLVLALLLLAGRRRPVRVLLGGTVLLGVLRISVQALGGDLRFVVGLGTVAVGIAVLTTAVSLLAGRPAGGGEVAFAVAVGAAAAVGLQLSLGTWDAYWRTDVQGWLVTLGLVTAMVALAVVSGRHPALAPSHGARRLWALGPFLALLLVMLANPAFAASQAGLPQAVGGPVHALGLLVAAWLLTRITPGASAVVALPILVGVVLVPDDPNPLVGVLVLVALVGAQVAAVTTLARALGTDAGGVPPGLPVRLAGAASLVGLGTILPPMVYQVAYDVPLGFPNRLALVAAAVALGAAGLRRATLHAGSVGAPARALVAASALVLLGAAVAATGALTTRADTTGQAEGNRVVMLWNIHFGVNPDGALDPEAVARTIEAYDPDVVLLNEISYGWVLGGGMDVGTWLSQRLERPLAFAPSADRQFGSAVLSRWEMGDVAVHRLPRGDGLMDRSAVSARVYVGGELTDVVSTQLQNKATYADTRVDQVRALIEAPAIRDSDRLVVAGDLNSNPGTHAIEVLAGAGLVSAIDAVGDPAALTYPSTDPEQRLDWVLGRGVTFQEARVLDEVRHADHLPVVVTIAP